MAAVRSPAELLDWIARSRLIRSEQLQEYVTALRRAGRLPDDPSELLAQFRRDRLLTTFQSRHLLRGEIDAFFFGGKYKILEYIGAGGMGRVYLCEQILLHRLVAVKVLPTAGKLPPGAVERFYREARAVAALDHPNIVKVHDIDRSDRFHYMVQEYIDGRDLDGVLGHRVFLPVERAVHYARQAALGLQHAHEAKLIHRDIKPGNLLLDRSGTIKILDLGLARFFDERRQDNITRDFDENVALGTADYLSPEQALASPDIDIRTDVYSLGGTLYHLLTGKPPFDGGTTTQKLLWSQTKMPTPAHEVRQSVPEGLSSVVERMMQKDPDDRYQTPAEVYEALQPWAIDRIDPPEEEEMPSFRPATLLLGLSDPEEVAERERTRRGPVGLPGEEPDDEDDPHPLTEEETLVPTVRITVEGNRRSRRKVWGLAAALVGLLVGAGVYFFLDGSPPRKTTAVAETDFPDPPIPAGVTLLVTREPEKAGLAGQPTVFLDLASAIKAAKPGAVIKLLDGSLEEQLDLDGKEIAENLTVISGAGGGMGSAVWRPVPGGDSKKPLLKLNEANGFRLHGFTLDGEGRLDELLVLNGSSTGVRLESLRLRGFNRTGLRLTNFLAPHDRPFEATRLRFTGNPTVPKDAAIRFGGTAESDLGPVRNVRFLGCSFIDSFRVGAFLGVSTSGVEFRRNRFYKVDTAIDYPERPQADEIGLVVDSNTFHDVQSGIALGSTPAPSSEGIRVRNNLAVRTSALVRTKVELSPATKGALFPSVEGNFRDRDQFFGQEGIFEATPVDFEPLSLSPDDDTRFLRYPPSSPLFKMGAGGEPVGVPGS